MHSNTSTATPYPPLSGEPWSAAPLKKAIGTLKEKNTPEALRIFIEERIDEMTQTGGAEALLARLHNELGLCRLSNEERD